MNASLVRGGRTPTRLGHIDDLVREGADWQCKHRDPGHAVMDCPELVPRLTRQSGLLLGAGVRRFAAEPLLQHYGVRTRWLDVVDNLWVALWFACHDFVGRDGYVHAVRRNLNDGGPESVYIVTVGLEGDRMTTHPNSPGWTRIHGAGRIVDLRMAAPSYYLRPHAQHGLLVRPQDDDFRKLKLAALKIRLPDALEWLGSSLLLSSFNLFPPPSVDDGYRRLLESSDIVKKHKLLGHVDVHGPGY